MLVLYLAHTVVSVRQADWYWKFIYSEPTLFIARIKLKSLKIERKTKKASFWIASELTARWIGMQPIAIKVNLVLIQHLILWMMNPNLDETLFKFLIRNLLQHDTLCPVFYWCCRSHVLDQDGEYAAQVWAPNESISEICSVVIAGVAINQCMDGARPNSFLVA